MLENTWVIFLILSFTLVVVSTVFAIFILISFKNGNPNDLKNIKIRIAFSSIICLICIFKIILEIILKNLRFIIGGDIILLLLWAHYITHNLLKEKKAKRPITVPIIIKSYFSNEGQEETEKITEKITGEIVEQPIK